MIQKQDLKSVRKSLGLSAKDLSSGMIRAATISEIETGKHLPRKSTRLLLESVLGPICWEKTLAGDDRSHLIFAITQFINPDGEGSAIERIKFVRQVLQLIEDEIINES
jgi:transcriptional regulator with XRE-family HTH domain